MIYPRHLGKSIQAEAQQDSSSQNITNLQKKK
jgi:hypothetical protein